MSTDYHLHCSACNVTIETVASGSIAYGDKVWSSPEALAKLMVFLLAHKGHSLVFLDENTYNDMLPDDEDLEQ